MPELKLENSLVDDRYEVRERLSVGSYAEIFVAHDRERSGQQVVIKALNTHLQGTPDAELERTLIENFQNEAIALDLVRHPQVILRLGHGTAADLRNVPFHYLVVEYMPGGDLLQACRTQPGSALKLDQALLYFRQICEALAFAHNQGIIHRDLKPNNFLLSADHQQVKIADFGVAKFTTQDSTEITRVGTGIYAPPEHHPDDTSESFGRLTAAADIYSLAKSFYTVVCGRAPNEFYRRQITALSANAQSQPWGEALLKVLCRATANEVSARYATVTEFWMDLAEVATHALDADADEVETQVRPRLRVNPGALPMAPATPEFEPSLSSGKAGTIAVQIASTGKTNGKSDYAAASSKGIVVDLKPAAPIAQVVAPPANNGVVATRSAKNSIVADEAVEATAPASARYWLKTALLVALFLVGVFGVMAGVYRAASRFAQNRVAPHVQILPKNLNVRTGPGTQFETIGAVSQGTTHRVLERGDGWVRIEVSQWSRDPDVMPHVNGVNQGWVSACTQCLKE